MSKLFRSKRYVTSVYGSATGWLRRAREIGYDNTAEIRAQRKLMTRESLNSRFADFIMVNSLDFIRDYVENHGYPAEKMSVVPNSIVVNEKIEFMKNHSNQFKMLYVGRLSKIKGIHLVLEAHQDILAEGHDVRLTVIGKPIDHDKPYLESRAWKNVDFIEEKSFEELIAYYQDADVCIHPSAQEGMPRVVMESLSFGTPVIASDLPGIRAIDSSGKFVKTMNRFDSATLKESILQEITSPRKTSVFFSDARKHMRSFSPESTATIIRANYEKLI
jgi:glycosyltransferase involved in cell wall biosynthesis